MLQAPIDPIAAVSHPDPYPSCAALRAHAGVRRHLVAGLSALGPDAQPAAAVDAMEGLLPLLAANGVEGLDESRRRRRAAWLARGVTWRASVNARIPTFAR